MAYGIGIRGEDMPTHARLDIHSVPESIVAIVA
jgi:hypothetical protein